MLFYRSAYSRVIVMDAEKDGDFLHGIVTGGIRRNHCRLGARKLHDCKT